MNQRIVTTSGKQALNAIYLLIGINILVYTYRNDFLPHLNINRTYRILDGNLQSMLLSIFYHVDPTHLTMNMLCIYQTGFELYVNSSSKRWRSFSMPIISYLICGFGSFYGVELLSKYHTYQMELKMQKARVANQCTHWMCKSINNALGRDVVSSYITNVWSDWTTTFPVKLSMWHFRLIRRIGASAAVYGWVGMRLFTSWYSPYHSKMHGLDVVLWMGILAHELSKCPLSLQDLQVSTFLEEGNVDHTAHFFGAIIGMLWAALVLLWDKVGGVFWRWRGESGGRRLGERWEDEYLAQERLMEQDQERRQLSRLLYDGERTVI